MYTLRDITLKVFCIGWIATAKKKSKVCLNMIDIAYDMIWEGKY